MNVIKDTYDRVITGARNTRGIYNKFPINVGFHS